MINDLKVGDTKVVVEGMITYVNMGKNSKSAYLSMNIQDSTGVLDCKLWSATNEQLELLTSGKVVVANGDIIKYNEGIQMKINSIEIKECDEAYRYQFVRKANIDLDEMKLLFAKTIDSIKHEELKLIASELYNKHQDLFIYYPAASKNHHEYLSGLAEHTYRMLKLAYMMCDLYPTLNRDLMVTGILLHDLGKIRELSGPIVPNYTLEGKLIGHISIGTMMIDEVIREYDLNSEAVLLLKHIILSHHGKLEFGSPVLPIIPEAEMISYIDNIDAKMNMMNKALSEIEEGEFTKRIFPLDNRSFYKAKK